MFWEKIFIKIFCESKELLTPDNSVHSFLKKCALVNEFFGEKNLFLRVYERRDKFRYLIKKK